MSYALGESVVKGAAGGLASFVAGKLIAPYAWSLVESTASHGKELATSALKASGVAAAAFAVAGAGYGAACWVSKRTDTTRTEGYDLILAGYKPETVENLHRYVPTATFVTSLAPLAYLAVRLIF
ncbi:MAG: hypothetical protein LLF94_11505 [Chlamydiales bacterium]|nr:hypothetical protein [Chlamydiales bacterium]